MNYCRNTRGVYNAINNHIHNAVNLSLISTGFDLADFLSGKIKEQLIKGSLVLNKASKIVHLGTRKTVQRRFSFITRRGTSLVAGKMKV